MRTLIYALVVIAVLFVMGATCTQSATLCPDGSLSCAIKNFDELYKNDYDRFWSIFHLAGKEAVTCTSIQKTAAFLEVASVKKGNAEFNEYFMSVLENQLILKNTKCFLEAMKLTSPNSRLIILNDLKNPLFADKKTIDNSLIPFIKNREYQEILKPYKVGQ